MGNLLDTIIKRIELPDKVSLSASDKEMLGQISKNLDEIKKLKDVFTEQGASLDKSLEVLKQSQDTEKLDEIMTSLNGVTKKMSTSLDVVADKIFPSLTTIDEKLEAIEKSVSKQISGVKIMTGFAIWSSLLGVAVLIVHILGFI